MSSAPVLCIRLDRIGDLVLSMPIDQAFAAENREVEWWISPGLGFIAENARPKRHYLEVSRSFSWNQSLRLWRHLRTLKPQIAIMLHVPWWIGLLVWLARVPQRIGALSQWHSFLFYNRGVRQRRSEGRYSELEYAFQLLDAGLGRQVTRHKLHLQAVEQAPQQPRGKYFVVHAGMAGSARNWPSQRYIEVIESLRKEAQVVMTGTLTDQEYLDPIKRHFAGNAQVTWLDGQLSANQLLSVLASAKGVLAPSTGVVHLAASLGVRTVGIYSPVRVQAAQRWGPQGPKTVALTPAVPECPGEMSCLRERCPHFDCMQLLGPQEVLAALRGE